MTAGHSQTPVRETGKARHGIMQLFANLNQFPDAQADRASDHNAQNQLARSFVLPTKPRRGLRRERQGRIHVELDWL